MTKQDCEWKISESHVRKPKKRGRKKMDEGKQIPIKNTLPI